jgi:hypothetical protein
LISAPASAAGSGSLTAFVDCVNIDKTTGEATAYLGYTNTTGSIQTVAIGDNNQLFPLSPNSGQPTNFQQGTVAQAFSVTFDPADFPAIAWILDGIEIDATAADPACVNGVTTQPTNITTTGATLNGVLIPQGPGAMYSFDYGTDPTLPTSTTKMATTTVNTTPQSFAGSQPGVVELPLTGLTPGTTYYARIDAETGSITTQGPVLSFTTTPLAPLVIQTTTLPIAAAGKAYNAQLTGTGGVAPYLWKISAGSLPTGLTLNSSTGVISGTTQLIGTAHFTVTLSDPALPTVQPISENLSITVNNAVVWSPLTQ